jgi:ADP-ribose pyrophosphatase YjhB (NUDIX family)
MARHPQLKIGVAAYVEDDDGRVLMIRENYGRHRFGFPGGEVETGESLHDALLREFTEETMATATVDHLIAIDHVLTDGGGWWLYALFRCQIESGVPTIPDTGEIAEVVWIDADAPPAPLTHAARKFLQAASAGRRGVVGWLT